MACLGAICGGCLCCCGACGASCCFAGVKATKLALRVVRHVRARPPCEKGLACNCQEGQHVDYYSHPDDDDYGFSIRIHGGDGEFCTMRQCFNFMDPYQLGYVKEFAALREVLHHASRKYPQVTSQQKAVIRSSKKLKELWDQIDSDGNGYISFPEWVEWVSSSGATQFGFPSAVGIFGEKGKAGAYNIPCTVEGCTCECFVKDPDNEKFCARAGCGHRAGLHSADHVALIAASLPHDWSLVFNSHDVRELSGQRQLVPLGDDECLQVQEIMNASVRRAWSRDRGRTEQVPDSYEVVRVERNENIRLWLKYLLKKTLMAEAINSPGFNANNTAVPMELYTMMTSEKVESLPFLAGNRADASLNEWFLWHGGSSEGIKSIADQEFKQLYAGKTTGTLYGSGTYLTDSCTKADEYAREDPATGLYGLLLCRVMGGRVLYNDQVSPDAKYLVNNVLQGPYDSVFGDREKCRNTFKEIVIYESSQAYPEYIVYYRRKYAPQEPAQPLASYKSET